MDGDPRSQLAELAAARGVTLSALSLMVGRNVAYLQQYVRRGSPRVLPERERAALADFLGVEESVLGGPERDGRDVRVPYLTVAASAGPGALAADERLIREEGIGRDLLRRAGVGTRDASIIRVQGDSMAPTLIDGDRVLVDRADVRPATGGIFVVRHDDDLWIKRLETRAAGLLRLASDNPRYAPIDLPLRDAAIVGRAKLLLRDMG